MLPDAAHPIQCRPGQCALQEKKTTEGPYLMNDISRRNFTKSTVAAAAGIAAVTRAHGASNANDKIRLGFIGVGNRGGQLIDAFMEHDDKEIVAICDVYALEI